MAALEQFSLKGKRALVTGSSAGIGLALASGMAEAGASVIINGRTSEKVAAAAAPIRAAGHDVHEKTFDVVD
ncbi:MAG: SDR family NAD(P)-dependent oxidoreductase, partial [Pseudomonadota bacterium]